VLRSSRPQHAGDPAGGAVSGPAAAGVVPGGGADITTLRLTESWHATTHPSSCRAEASCDVSRTMACAMPSSRNTFSHPFWSMWIFV